MRLRLTHWRTSLLSLTAVACTTAVEPPPPPQCLYGTPSGVVLLMDCEEPHEDHVPPGPPEQAG